MATCRTCRRSFTRSWFRLNQRSEYCSGACRKAGSEIANIGNRIDRLMDLHREARSEYVGDTFLVLADRECARLKVLTRWEQS